METIIATLLNTVIQLWANHANKPPGWEPSAQDYADMRSQVDAATPEAMKAAARVRLGLAGLVPNPPVVPDSPQAPVG